MNCQWSKAWIGRCQNKAVDCNAFCEEHIGKICSGCKEVAIRDCEDTVGALVCGCNLCHKCIHLDGWGFHQGVRDQYKGNTMKADELRVMTDSAIAAKEKRRPLELKTELIDRMTSLAKSGIGSLDFVFKDTEPVIAKTLELLKEDGFRILNIGYAVRFEW